MRVYDLIPHDTKIDFVGKRFYTIAICVAVTVISLCGFWFKGLNYGIDFRGGLVLELRTQEKVDVSSLRKKLSEIDLGEVSIQEFGSDHDVLIRVPNTSDNSKDQQVIVKEIKAALGDNVEYRKVETVGPKVGAELVTSATYAVLIALAAILMYIWFRFEWQFSLCGVIALVNDIIILLGLYSFCHYFEFNINAIVALLTTMSYSIHDTVVVYDRIRENLRKYANLTLYEVINKSMNETLSRTILTSFTSIISLAALCIFGGKVIFDFSFPILFGFLFGTFSSIFLAAPLLLYTGLKFEGRVIPIGIPNKK